MGMLDFLAQTARGMLGTPEGIRGLEYLQMRHHGMSPGEIAAQRAQQDYYEAANAQRQAEEEERLKRQQQEQRQADMAESQKAAAGILSGMTPEQQQAYLRDPQQMAWWGGQDADKGLSQAVLGSIASTGTLDKKIDSFTTEGGKRATTWQKPDGSTYTTYSEESVRMPQGASPFFQFMPTAEGIVSGNTRTGDVTLAPGGEGVTPIAGDPQQQAAILAAKEWAKRDTAFEAAAQNDAPRLASSVDRLKSTLDAVSSGDAQTGIIEGEVLKLVDPETALLEAEKMIQTLEALQLVNLAPVTVQEIKMLQEMFASATKTKEINVALLRRAIGMSEKALNRLRDQYDYFASPDPLTGRPRSTLRGYMPPELRRRDPATIPKLGDVSPDEALRRYGNP